jgi:transcriptional regulator with XRE-family HTH domain
VPVRSAQDLAAIVKGRRKEIRLSQAELAARAGVARKSISELEGGKSRPELGLLLSVLEQLGLVLEIHGAPSERRVRGTVDLDAVLEEHRRR